MKEDRFIQNYLLHDLIELIVQHFLLQMEALKDVITPKSTIGILHADECLTFSWPIPR